VVPGNHDVPLYNPYLRFVSKLARFREFIDADIEPRYMDEAMAVIGINTSRALAWKGGRIGKHQVERVRSGFDAAETTALKVLVVHHPMDIPLRWGPGLHARRASRALAEWADCGIGLILAGHAHRALASNDVSSFRMGNHQAVIVQAGTATSTRVRGEPNSFNAIHIDRDRIRVVRETWNRGAGRFEESHEDVFQR